MVILAEDVARVREATDVVRLISATVALRKAGRRWQGLCPFHNEKTPSFSVNAEEGLYYCFGCGASGDAITFVRETEGLDFAAGVEVLAARAGITLRYDDKGEAAQSGRRKKLVEVVAAAVEWYHERLLRHADAGAARGYLRSRGIDGEQVRAFKLGWAPRDWDALSRALRQQVPPAALVDAGLAYRNKRDGLNDTFRARVLFPVFDVRGDPVGFGGRILPGDDERAGPKYKNTPESPLYVKSRLLYGLNWAKDAVVRARDGEGEVIVCEGYTDVIGLRGAGWPHAVATCGTALTEDHVKILSRFTKRILLAFDADAAGAAAAERIYHWESSHGLDVFVAELPEGADPDDLARRAPEELRQKLEEPRSFLDYRIDRALEGVEGATAQGRVRFADAALAALDEHPSEIVRDRYLVTVADRCKLDPDLLRPTVERYRAARGRRASGGGGPSGARSDEPADPSIAEQVLLLRVHAPAEVPGWMTARLFESDIERRIFTALARGASLRDLQDAAGDEAAASVARLAVCEPPQNADAVIGQFVYNAATRRIAALAREARRSGDAALGRRLAETQLARDELLASDWSPAAAERLAGLLDGPSGGAEGAEEAPEAEDLSGAMESLR
ncbi:MAG: DNA primase [bacterium]|nr:DNA primase [bacterium]